MRLLENHPTKTVNVSQFLPDKIFCYLSNVHVVITLGQYNPVGSYILGLHMLNIVSTKPAIEWF